MNGIKRLTRQEAREVDRLAIEQFGIPGIVLMENAAMGVAAAAEEMLAAEGMGSAGGRILVLCGGGNNGGDGLAVARHLHNRGHAIEIALTVDPASYKGDALINWRIVRAMKLPVLPADPPRVAVWRGDLVVDAIFGTGLTTPPREPFAQIVASVASAGVPVLAVDLPSGLDCDTGLPLRACIRAARTVTFVAEKTGFANPVSRQYTGIVTVAGIGIRPA